MDIGVGFVLYTRCGVATTGHRGMHMSVEQHRDTTMTMSKNTYVMTTCAHRLQLQPNAGVVSAWRRSAAGLASELCALVATVADLRARSGWAVALSLACMAIPHGSCEPVIMGKAIGALKHALARVPATKTYPTQRIT